MILILHIIAIIIIIFVITVVIIITIIAIIIIIFVITVVVIIIMINHHQSPSSLAMDFKCDAKPMMKNEQLSGQ